MVKNSRNSRALKNPDDDKMVYFEKKLYDEIKEVMTHKRNLTKVKEKHHIC